MQRKLFRTLILGLVFSLLLGTAALAANSGYVTAQSGLRIRTGASTSYSIITALPYGTTVNITDSSNGWYQVEYNGITGWMYADYITITSDSSDDSDSTDEDADSTDSITEEIIEYAMQYLGCSYVYGSTGPYSFDCSGLVNYVFENFGYDVDRTVATLKYNGTYVSYDDLEPGDLVFFSSYVGGSATHVGIYIGNGQFIHASSTAGKVIISSFTSYYLSHYYTARRII